MALPKYFRAVCKLMGNMKTLLKTHCVFMKTQCVFMKTHFAKFTLLQTWHRSRLSLWKMGAARTLWVNDMIRPHSYYSSLRCADIQSGHHDDAIYFIGGLSGLVLWQHGGSEWLRGWEIIIVVVVILSPSFLLMICRPRPYTWCHSWCRFTDGGLCIVSGVDTYYCRCVV